MKYAFPVLVFLLLFLTKTNLSFAIENPLNLPNNKMGVHILFTNEIDSASTLVNSNGGDWGYVIIPIQAGDRSLEKWQKFMDLAKKNHVIPIIRLAVEGDYFNTKVWKKPGEDTVLDFANFLNSLDWPVKNRYIVVFNEVNRGDEWGGIPNPGEYARILSYAVDIFKTLNEDYFIISSGLDNASANIPNSSINQYDFMIQMNQEVPGIFNKIDGLGSHSYPNPAFSVPPWVITNKSISSFKYEKSLVYSLSGKNLPVFITETGWSSKKVAQNQIALYFTYAFDSVWSDESIAAVTPFLLHAGGEPFGQFSLLSENGQDSNTSLTLKNITKVKGQPTINRNTVLSPNIPTNKNQIPLKAFSQKIQYENLTPKKTRDINAFLAFFKWLLKLPM